MDNVPYFQITNKFCDGAFDKELVAVLKKVYYFLLSRPMDMEVLSGTKLKLSVLLKLKLCFLLYWLAETKLVSYKSS